MSSVSQKLVYVDGAPHWLSDAEIAALRTKPAKRADDIPMVTSGYSESKPGKSISMSVHPDDCARMNRELKKRGIQGVHYDPSKRDNCVIESRSGRRDWMPHFGELVGLQNVHDSDGGYGDG